MSVWYIMVMLDLVAISGCGRLGFDAAGEDCVLEMLDESFASEITAWNAVTSEDVLTAVVAHDASCAPDLTWIDAQLTTSPPRGTVSELELDWEGALGSYFFSSTASSYGPMLATRIDSFLAAAGTATARQRVDRISSDDREYRLVVYSAVSGLAVTVDGRHHEEDDD